MNTENEIVFGRIPIWARGLIILASLALAAFIALAEGGWSIGRSILLLSPALIIVATFRRYEITLTDLGVRVSRKLSRLHLGFKNLDIPRERLTGVGALAPGIRKKTGLFYRDENNHLKYLPVDLSKASSAKFMREFNKLFPELRMTEEGKIEVFDEVFGEKLWEVRLLRKPAEWLLGIKVIIFILMVLMLIDTFLAIPRTRELVDLSFPQFISYSWEHQRGVFYLMAGWLAAFGLFVFSNVKVLTGRLGAKDRIFTIYRKGLLSEPVQEFPMFIQWEDIVSFGMRKLPPTVFISVKTPHGFEYGQKSYGSISSTDFSEMKQMIESKGAYRPARVIAEDTP